MPSNVVLINAATSTQTSQSLPITSTNTTAGNVLTFSAEGTTTAGSGSATAVVEASNSGNSWITLGTITLALGTTITADGFASVRWPYIRARLTSISGTGASVSVNMGV